MCPLLSSQKQFLLEIARHSMMEAVHKRASTDIFSLGGNALVCTGVFASLHRKRRLRGCIGQIGSRQPAAPLVAYCARAAALEDPRFRPVEPHELAEVEIELSILSALQVAAPEQIEIGKHGLVITSGARRGVLLPQVAVQYNWTATRFLEETCAKAGLNRDAWRGSDTRIEAFTAEVFAESQLCAEASAALEPHAGPSYSNST